jgi:hypothetical protein
VIYGQLIRFLLPLVLTVVAQELSGQVLNGGITRVPDATETLASYGLAWGIVTLLASPLNQVKQLGLVLVENVPCFVQVRRFVAVLGSLLAGILVVLALSPLGTWVVEGLHGISSELGGTVRTAILWLAPYPIVRGGTLFYSGLLLRIRRADVASLAILANIAASVAAVFTMLPTGLIQQRPVLLPVLVIYAGALSELAVVIWGYRRLLVGKLDLAGTTISPRQIIHFFWPLALITMLQGLSRPLINLFIARGTDGAEALAVLTVVYSLAHVLYGWLNEIRSLPTAFRQHKDAQRAILRFAWACGFFSFALMVGIFWTPLGDLVVGSWIGLSAELSPLAKGPLIVFSFFPLAVMNRAYLNGVGLLERRTKAMAPSGISRILTILMVLLLTVGTNMNGATRGIVALLSGFVLETITLWWGVRGGAYWMRLSMRDRGH